MQVVVQAQAVKVTLVVYKAEFVRSRKTSRRVTPTLPKSRWNSLSLAYSYEVHFLVSFVYCLSIQLISDGGRGDKTTTELIQYS